MAEIPIPTTHRLATAEELVSKKLRAELEDRLAQLAQQETGIAEERKRLETLLAHHPDAAAADGLEFMEHSDAGWLVKK